MSGFTSNTTLSIAIAMAGLGLALSMGATAVPTRADTPAPKPRGSADSKPTTNPPSGDVRVTYTSQKTIACEVVNQSEGPSPVQCQGRFVEAFAPTSLKLVPITKSGEPDARRGLVDIEFAARAAEHIREVQLEAGPWKLKWGALTERFFVNAGDEFDVELVAQDGVCHPEGARCRLEVGKKTKSVEFPEARRSK